MTYNVTYLSLCIWNSNSYQVISWQPAVQFWTSSKFSLLITLCITVSQWMIVQLSTFKWLRDCQTIRVTWKLNEHWKIIHRSWHHDLEDVSWVWGTNCHCVPHYGPHKRPGFFHPLWHSGPDLTHLRQCNVYMSYNSLSSLKSSV